MIEIQPHRWNYWAAVAPSWHLLAARSGSSFFLTPAWVETWLEVFGEQLNTRLLTFVDAGEVVGACLLVRHLHWRKFIPMRRMHLNFISFGPDGPRVGGPIRDSSPLLRA